MATIQTMPSCARYLTELINVLQAAELGELKLENKLLKRLWTAFRAKEAQMDNHLQKLEARFEDMADEMRVLEGAYEAQVTFLLLGI